MHARCKDHIAGIFLLQSAGKHVLLDYGLPIGRPSAGGWLAGTIGSDDSALAGRQSGSPSRDPERGNPTPNAFARQGIVSSSGLGE